MLPSMAEDISNEPDFDIEPKDNFDDLRASVKRFEELFGSDEKAKMLLKQAESAIAVAIDDVEKAREQAEGRFDDDDWDWRGRSGTKELPSTDSANRSIFSDVDE